MVERKLIQYLKTNLQQNLIRYMYYIMLNELHNQSSGILWTTLRLTQMSPKVLSLSQDQYHIEVSIVIDSSHNIFLVC